MLILMSDVFSLSAVPTGDQAQSARKDTRLIWNTEAMRMQQGYRELAFLFFS